MVLRELSPEGCYGLVVAELGDIAPDRYASFVAPVIERLVLAVVNLAIAGAAGASVPPAAPADAMRMLGQLRTALLSRPITADGLAAVYRYRDPANVQRDVEELVAGGLVERAGDDTVQATERGRVMLIQMHNVSAPVADYHRQDAHAAAWQAAGYTSTTVTQLPVGAERAAIEAETNRRDAALYASLTPDERLAFLAGLAALPG
jgi:hypothetical protein